MKKNAIDCLIPFYNESSRIMAVVHAALATDEIHSVICINDGSTDNIQFDANILNNKKFKLLSHSTNRGKTQAVKTGLASITTDYVILLDADLIGLTSKMLSNIINYTLLNDLDLMILRCINTLPLTRLLKMDILLSGQRIVKSSHLHKILTQNLVGYELEIATNNYFLNNKCRTTYTTQSLQQYRKIDKVGLLKGVWGDLSALSQILKYSGIKQTWKQILNFHPKEVKI